MGVKTFKLLIKFKIMISSIIRAIILGRAGAMFVYKQKMVAN
jgi:hypothetical protein